MKGRAAELAAVAALALAAAVGWATYEIVLGNPGGRSWVAAFTNSRGLLAGNDVRDGGAIVGRVTAITLSRDGHALVHFQLSDRVATPRSDAAAAIEPEDLLGDNYLSLSPGSSPQRLRGLIPVSRTVDAPRLDEVLDAFQPNVRDGLQTLILEAGLALDQRGGDIAQAAVGLRPALTAAGSLLSELNSQNGSLATVLPVAERAAGQLDSGRAEIPVALEGLARTLQATASQAGALGASTAGLPAMLRQVASTSGELQRVSSSGGALAARLGPELSALTRVVRGLPGLLTRVRNATPALQGAMASATSALVTGTPALQRLSTAAPVLRGQAPRLATLLSELDAAAPGIADGFFVDFPDQAAESGKQPFDPFADPRRSYWRGAAVFSCEAFGVPVAPGCLAKALANLGRQPMPSPAARAPRTGRPAGSPTRPAPSPGATSATTPTTSTTTTTTTSSTPAPPPSAPPSLPTQLLNFLLTP
jgi:phospholipid/cholesterol/gamma-HCH transport system substrate-binding protein